MIKATTGDMATGRRDTRLGVGIQNHVPRVHMAQAMASHAQRGPLDEANLYFTSYSYSCVRSGLLILAFKRQHCLRVIGDRISIGLCWPRHTCKMHLMLSLNGVERLTREARVSDALVSLTGFETCNCASQAGTSDVV